MRSPSIRVATTASVATSPRSARANGISCGTQPGHVVDGMEVELGDHLVLGDPLDRWFIKRCRAGLNGVNRPVASAAAIARACGTSTSRAAWSRDHESRHPPGQSDTRVTLSVHTLGEARRNRARTSRDLDCHGQPAGPPLTASCRVIGDR